MPSVYLDSCVVIYLIQGPPELHRSVATALAPPEGNSPSIHVSDLTRLECRVWPMRQGDAELLGQYDAFFAVQGVTRVPMTTEVFDLATSLRAAHRIRTADALHLAAAMVGGCEEFWTNDRRLSAAASPRIRICVPFE